MIEQMSSRQTGCSHCNEYMYYARCQPFGYRQSAPWLSTVRSLPTKRTQPQLNVDLSSPKHTDSHKEKAPYKTLLRVLTVFYHANRLSLSTFSIIYRREGNRELKRKHINSNQNLNMIMRGNLIYTLQESHVFELFFLFGTISGNSIVHLFLCIHSFHSTV